MVNEIDNNFNSLLQSSYMRYDNNNIHNSTLQSSSICEKSKKSYRPVNK